MPQPRLLHAEALPLRQATADPELHRRHSITQRQVCLSLCRVSWSHTVLFEPSECLWQVWSLILNTISPLLPSCGSFSFVLGHRVSFLGEIQHSPVDGFSAVSCNFGVLAGEDLHTSFYSAIL